MQCNEIIKTSVSATAVVSNNSIICELVSCNNAYRMPRRYRKKHYITITYQLPFCVPGYSM